MNNALFQTLRQSGVVGQFIIVLLFGMSVYAWYIIVDKLRLLRSAERSSGAFLGKFHREGRRIFSLRFPTELAEVCPLYRIYEEGVRALGMLPDPAADPAGGGLTLEQQRFVEESLERAISREVMGLETSMVVLAVTATIGPLLGLLGTVWGIMNAFQGMGAAGSASIGTVAPGISEALVTTVVGLLVAIPALAGYNVIANRIRRLTTEMNNFASEFVSTAAAAAADRPAHL